MNNNIESFLEHLYLNKYICLEDWLNSQKKLTESCYQEIKTFVNDNFNTNQLNATDDNILLVYSKYIDLKEKVSSTEAKISYLINDLISLNPYFIKLKSLNAKELMNNKVKFEINPPTNIDLQSTTNKELSKFIDKLIELKNDENFLSSIKLEDKVKFHSKLEKYSINKLVADYQDQISNFKKYTNQLTCLTTYSKCTVNLEARDMDQEAIENPKMKTYIFSSSEENIFLVKDFLSYQNLVKYFLKPKLEKEEFKILPLNKIHKVLKKLDRYSKTLIQSNFLNLELDNTQNLDLENSELKELLMDFTKLINSLNTNHDNKHEIFYRGHSNSNYILSPSIFRNENLTKNENKLYHETIIRCSDFFQYSKNNLEILTLMQHYAIPTRLLDITTNPLTALYFTVSENSQYDGEVLIFSTNSDTIKYYHSDTVEILATLSVMNSMEKTELLKAVSSSMKQLILSLNKLIKSNISINNDILNKELANTIDNFNKIYVVKKLVHEINKRGAFFQGNINPFHLINSYFVLPIMNNNRITRQSGAFIITGLLNKNDSHSNLYNFKFKLNNKNHSYSNSNLKQDFSQNKIVVFPKRKISKEFYQAIKNKTPEFVSIFEKEFSKIASPNDRNEQVRIIIPETAKQEMLNWLDTFDINRATIYPEIEKVAQHLTTKYESN